MSISSSSSVAQKTSFNQKKTLSNQPKIDKSQVKTALNVSAIHIVLTRAIQRREGIPFSIKSMGNGLPLMFTTQFMKTVATLYVASHLSEKSNLSNLYSLFVTKSGFDIGLNPLKSIMYMLQNNASYKEALKQALKAGLYGRATAFVALRDFGGIIGTGQVSKAWIQPEDSNKASMMKTMVIMTLFMSTWGSLFESLRQHSIKYPEATFRQAIKKTVTSNPIFVIAYTATAVLKGAPIIHHVLKLDRHPEKRI